jgi:hypothetical protein
MTGPMAMAVAPFVKLDTLIELTRSLLACDGIGDLHLVFLQDSTVGMRSPGRYPEAAAAVSAFLDAFADRYRGAFASIDVGRNERNLGPYQTCKLAVDRAMERSDFVIFAEDDAVFARDALGWFAFGRDELIGSGNIVAVAPEGIYFTSTSVALDAAERAEVRRQADRYGLAAMYRLIGGIPSTCFAVDRRGWQEFGHIRGEIVGDTKLRRHFREAGLACAQPIVPRMRDIGMVHPLGHSARYHGADNITNRKLVWLTSDDLAMEARTFVPLEGGGAVEAGRWLANLARRVQSPAAVETVGTGAAESPVEAPTDGARRG